MTILDFSNNSSTCTFGDTNPSASIQIINLDRDERAALARLSSQAVLGAQPTSPRHEVQQAEQLAERIQHRVPRLGAMLARLKTNEIDACFITGLPQEPETARKVVLALTVLIGKPFNYISQNDGDIVMSLQPKAGSAANTNSTGGEFKTHTDDAFIEAGCRVKHISLYGIINPPDTLTGYAPLRDAVADIAWSLLKRAQERRFSVRAPLSFGLGGDIWSEPMPLIKYGPNGEVELRFPSYATRPVDPRDAQSWEVIQALEAALDSHMVEFAVDPGTFFSFNNLRGAHRRGAIRTGDRLILRTYAADSLAPLHKVTGEEGPIFPLAPFMDSKLH